MLNRISGALLIAAASLFWLCWAFMPGVGITDAKLILDVVATHRWMVMTAVILQLISAALYVPAVLGLLATLKPTRAIQWGAGALLIGAMGSAADSVFHLLAYAMTEPGNLDQQTLLRVMAFMQGPGLVLVLPLILSLFAGGPWLSSALAKAGYTSSKATWLHASAVLVGVVGAFAASADLVSARAVGLAVLAAVSLGQACTGWEVFRLTPPVSNGSLNPGLSAGSLLRVG